MESKTKTNDVGVEMEAFAVVRREMLKILKDKPEGKDDRLLSTVLHVSDEWIEDNKGNLSEKLDSFKDAKFHSTKYELALGYSKDMPTFIFNLWVLDRFEREMMATIKAKKTATMFIGLLEELEKMSKMRTMPMYLC